MFKVTLDIFSGRENPSLLIDGSEERSLLVELSRNRNSLTSTDDGYAGLGFRGLILEALDDDTHERFSLPSSFRIAGGSSQNEAKAQEIAERLIKSISKVKPHDGIAAAPQFEQQVLDMMASLPASSQHAVADVDAQPAAAAPAATCFIELGAFNPGFWNDAAYIRRNNCYNYASNKRTNTFAQPGRGSGHIYTSLTCPAVTAAAISDGLHRRFNCFPDSEAPRWLVALVVAPGYDYHWYRRQREGFWGHKPGGTAARNTDNNGVVIFNPETAARAPYTDFCGYFYVPRSQRIN
jgi:hypothetical protein